MDLECIFSLAHRQIRPRTPVPEIKVQFFPFAGINHTARLHVGQLLVRVSDIFVDAPLEVYQSLALILLGKLYRKKIDLAHHRTYRAFILRQDIQERAQIARQDRGRVTRSRGARGRYVNLESSFDRVNATYFGGELLRPKLSWSAKRARYILGRYDSTHQAIFISRVFDSSTVPTYVIDYVMFHELLHMKHHSRINDCRMIVHPPEFKVEERRFAQYREAKLWLKRI
jgi:predicted metal-dependent hydrolase